MLQRNFECNLNIAGDNPTPLRYTQAPRMCNDVSVAWTTRKILERFLISTVFYAVEAYSNFRIHPSE